MECLVPGGALRGGCATLVAAFLTFASLAEAQTVVEPDYRLGPNDQIEIAVLEDESLNVERRVSTSGTVILPLVGEISVAGLTTEQVRASLERALEKDFLRQATVDVRVATARSQPISVVGAVEKPGTLYLSGTWRLSQALLAAGGVAAGHRGVVEVRRQAANGFSDRLELDLAALMGQGDATLDIPIFANDVINVPVAADITVYFLGAISLQGAVTIKGTERATLLTAIARAGGLTDRAASRLVIRRDRDGAEPLEIVANFRKILAGTAPDVELQDGDLIVVKEAFL